jgi:hypothetical protein
MSRRACHLPIDRARALPRFLMPLNDAAQDRRGLFAPLTAWRDSWRPISTAHMTANCGKTAAVGTGSRLLARARIARERT